MARGNLRGSIRSDICWTNTGYDNEKFDNRVPHPRHVRIAPFWDGNETWLVATGAGLFAAFPDAYAVFLSAFYFPVLLLLFGLIFRGIGFEFRFRTERMRPLW